MRLAWFLAILLVGEMAHAAEEAPTFNRDVAPIIFANCVPCHYPGGAGPYPFTTYREVKKRVEQIAKVTGSRYMPPWLPEPGRGDFEGSRRLSDEQVATLARWVKTGAEEGAAADLKIKSEWHVGWRMGPPDLVVTMPEAFSLPASGPDIYRNFVIPNVVPQERYVTAFELDPGATRAVHHAFVLLDPRGSARRLDRQDAEPGFPGMSPGAEVSAPRGAFASWQPGSMPQRRPPDMAWVLPKKSDLVLQVHMRPTGKKEKVQVRVGFYFTDRPPTRLPLVLCLRSTAIDIPAGVPDYTIDCSYTLPVDGDILSVLPHEHYLGKEARAWADLPDGAQRDLLWIKRWDFNWQGAYNYATPVSLPKGTTIRMRYTYDNSDVNPHNPNQPPKRVRYGLESTDEMGEFWWQFLPKREADMPVLQRHFLVTSALPDKIALARTMLDRNPHDAIARTELAAAFTAAGKQDEAIREAQQALVDDPKLGRAHAVLGSVYVSRNQLAEARAEFEALVTLEADNSDAQNNLGFLLLAEGRAKEAIPHLEKALELNPEDSLAKQNLEKARSQAKP